MKKLFMALMAVMAIMAFTACDEGIEYIEGLTTEEKAIIKQALEITNGENGASAYEVAVENGFEGTEDEWLASLQGADGTDGVDGVCELCGIDPEPEPIDDGMILMTFTTEENLTDVKIGHTLNGYLVSVEDALVQEDNGTYFIEGNVTVTEAGTHMVGISFDIPEVVEVPEPVDPVEPIDPIDPIDPVDPLVEQS